MDDRDNAGALPQADEPDAEARPAHPGADDGWGGLPVGVPEDDFDADAEMARWVADIEAGRERIPEEWELDGSAVSLSLGDACDLDPALLAAMLGPDGLGGQSLSPAFGQDRAADALRPGPVLAVLTEQAVGDLAALSDDELTGALHAARRLEARAAYLQTVSVAEFARRREAAFQDAKARGVRPGRRPGEFAADELASELVCTANYAGVRLERDIALTSRLPKTLAGMATGTISGDRADLVAAWTMSLSDADAARADEILAAAAPGLRYEQLSRKAAALEMKLNPEGVKARKEHAKATRQRVELRREDSGNAFNRRPGDRHRHRPRLQGVRRRGRGPHPQLRPRRGAAVVDRRPGDDRALAGPQPPRPDQAPAPARTSPPTPPRPRPPAHPETERRRQRLPEHPRPRRSPGPITRAIPDDPEDVARPGPRLRRPRRRAPAWTSEEAENARHTDPDDPSQRRGPLRPTQSAPPPANLNLIIPIGTLLGWSTTPAQAGSFGLLDPEETKVLVAAASLQPQNPLGRHPHRPGRPGDRARPRPRPAPVGTPAPRAPASNAATGNVTTGRRPGSSAPPPRPGARHHLRPHCPGHLRPPAGREPLHPQPQAQGPDPRPHSHLRRPRLRRPGHLLRPRPHRGLPRGPDRPVQPRPEVQTPPSSQAGAGVERRAA